MKFTARFVFAMVLLTLVANQAVAQSRRKVDQRRDLIEIRVDTEKKTETKKKSNGTEKAGEKPKQLEVQPRPKVEKMDQRDRLLAELDVKTKKEIEDAKKTKILNDEKIRQLSVREQTQQKALKSATSDRQRRTIQERLHRIEAEKDDLLAELQDLDVKKISDDAEQERRRIIMKFPRPGDPKYVMVEGGRILPEAEVARLAAEKKRLAEEKARLAEEERVRLENSKDPRQVADRYAQLMVDRGILKSFKFVGTEETVEGAGPIAGKPVTRYSYQVVYVSRAGLVNERVCGVDVYSSDGIHWEVSPVMFLGGTPGMFGLPQQSPGEQALEAFNKAALDRALKPRLDRTKQFGQ
jgi:hypothetical protein